jgi:hypothetical protein
MLHRPAVDRSKESDRTWCRPALILALAGLVCSVLAFAAVGAAAIRSFSACKALQDSFDPFWKSKVVTGPLAAPPSFRVAGGGRVSICEWSGRRQANGGFDYALRFNFTASRSVAEAKQTFSLMKVNPKNAKLHVAGADEAYGRLENVGGEAYGTIFARRGRYTASLATGVPAGAGEGCLCYDRVLLERFLRRAPKT